MPSYRAPGVYVEEMSSGSRPITPVGTSTAAFVGAARRGPLNKATLVTNFAEFERTFGGPYPISTEHYLFYAVRHFFEQGGSRCYVVRVAQFGPNAKPFAERAFNGTLPDDSAASPALKVSAISPGEWGRELTVRVAPTTKFSVRLADDIARGDAKQIMLDLNDQVQPGSLLWVARTVTGFIAEVLPSSSDPNVGAVRLSPDIPLKVGDTPFNDQLTTNTPVFCPGFSYVGSTNSGSPIDVTNGLINDSQAIPLRSLKKVDGTALRAGDPLTFAVESALVVVNRVTAQHVKVGDELKVVTVAEFVSQHLPAVPKGSRVYARDFTLIVQRKDEILEVHENLSLVNGNQTDHVDIRLGTNSGGSQFITASDQSGDKDQVLVNPDAQALQHGDDGKIEDKDLMDGIDALTPVRDASILVVPNATKDVTTKALSYCENRRDLVLILDRPKSVGDIESYLKQLSRSTYATIYHPWIEITDAITGAPAVVPASGAVAGIYALTDSRRGVHKAPAGLDTGKVVVARGVEKILSKGEYDGLYQNSINGILKLRDGIHVWGSRTLAPDNEWSQINVRRLFIFLEKSIQNGTQWVTFEPNDPALWKSIERNVAAFLRIQWLEGKLVGNTEKEAFFVHCNAETNPLEVVNAGQVITVIGAAPSRPAEFVIFRLKQNVGQPVS